MALIVLKKSRSEVVHSRRSRTALADGHTFFPSAARESSMEKPVFWKAASSRQYLSTPSRDSMPSSCSTSSSVFSARVFSVFFAVLGGMSSATRLVSWSHIAVVLDALDTSEDTTHRSPDSSSPSTEVASVSAMLERRTRLLILVVLVLGPCHWQLPSCSSSSSCAATPFCLLIRGGGTTPPSSASTRRSSNLSSWRASHGTMPFLRRVSHRRSTLAISR